MMKVHSDTQCVAVDAQVARLEAKLVEAERDYERVAQADDAALNRITELAEENETLRAACVAKDAALRQGHADTEMDGPDRVNDGVGAQRLREKAAAEDAALSPGAGEGWLPPEVREQARRALIFYTQESIHWQFHPGYRDERDEPENCPDCTEGRAALDALGGK